MMHSGFEAGIVQGAFTNPVEFGKLAGSYMKNGLAGARKGKSRSEREEELVGVSGQD
jgi:hypothetical protein